MRVKNKQSGKSYEVIGTYFDNDNGEGRVYFGDTEHRPLADTTFRSFMTDYEPIDEKIIDFEPIAVSRLAKVEIADRDYTEGDKAHFAFEEALKITQNMEDGRWRLPTRHEWVLICEEFGVDVNGGLSADKLSDSLKLRRAGWKSDDTLDNAGERGYYWSSTARDGGYAYYLYFYSGSVYQSNYGSRYAGFSVRLVRDVKE